jgi:hypothetical protein
MNRWTLAVAGALVACLFSTDCRIAAASPYEELAAKLPSDANVVMAADIQGLFRTKLGVDRHWADKVANDFRSGMITTCPTTLRVLVGESFDYATLQPRWRVKVNQLSKDVTPQRVSQKFGGSVDTVAGLPVVVCPRDHLFVNYSPTLVGEINGMQRQELSRVLRTTSRSTGVTLSPYLAGLLGAVGDSAQVVMGFDLEDVFHSSGLQSKLASCKTLKDLKIDMDQLGKTLEGLRGAQMRMKVDADIRGELRLDFTGSAEPLRGVGKGLILEVLEHIGAEISDLSSWDTAVEGNSFVMRGTLAPASARLILSPVENRASHQAYLDSQMGDGQQTATLDAQGIANVEYYRSLRSLLADIEPGPNTKANSTDRRTFYYRQYADKIDSLPILNVDPKLIQFGQNVSTTLRNLSRFSQSTKYAYENAQAQYRQDFATNTYGGYYGGYNGYYGGYYNGGWAYSAYTPSAVNVDNFMEVRNMMAATAQTSQAAREQTWANIQRAMQTVRQQLVEKYKTEV